MTATVSLSSGSDCPGASPVASVDGRGELSATVRWALLASDLAPPSVGADASQHPRLVAAGAAELTVPSSAAAPHSFYATVDEAVTGWYDDPEGRHNSPWLNAREARTARRAMGTDW